MTKSTTEKKRKNQDVKGRGNLIWGFMAVNVQKNLTNIACNLPFYVLITA